MNQKLSDWASIAEIVSGVAVVVTLVFLVLGIQANTEITRASMFDASLARLGDTDRVIFGDPRLVRIWEAFLTEKTGELSQDDEAYLQFIVVERTRAYDTAHSMLRYGLFGDNEWSRYERQICSFHSSVIAASQRELVRTVGSDDFNAYFEKACEE